MKQVKSSKAREYALIFFSILFIIIVLTAVDYIVHDLNEEDWGVPYYYYKNKVIFGTLIGIVVFFFIRKTRLSLPIKTTIFSGSIASLLQIRYALEGYAMDFVLLFLVLHFLMLWPIAYFGFRLMRKRFDLV